MTFLDKVARFSRRPFQPGQMLWVRPAAYPIVEHLKGASLGEAPALLTNIRLEWNCLPGAYYRHFLIMAIKSFITLPPGACIIKNYGRNQFRTVIS
jgi:hypothetical protein